MKSFLKSVRQSIADREAGRCQPHTETVLPVLVRKTTRTERRLAFRQAAEKAKKSASAAAHAASAAADAVHAASAAAAAALVPPPPVPLAKWLAAQPGSTRRGVARGKFNLPSYVIG